MEKARQHSTLGGLLLLLAGLPQGGFAAPAPIPVPSGATVWWQETRTDAAGPEGPTARYRFVMPDLATVSPPGAGALADEVTPAAPGADMMDRPGEDIDLSGDGGEAGDGQLVTIEELGLDAAQTDDDGAIEAAADGQGGHPLSLNALPPDPVREDMQALCDRWVLPRLTPGHALPAQVMISLAEREVPFGDPAPGVAQRFEAFTIPPDRSRCELSPW